MVTSHTQPQRGCGQGRAVRGNAKDTKDDFTECDGLVQPRMELTLRCAPINSILWGLGVIVRLLVTKSWGLQCRSRML